MNLLIGKEKRILYQSKFLLDQLLINSPYVRKPNLFNLFVSNPSIFPNKYISNKKYSRTSAINNHHTTTLFISNISFKYFDIIIYFKYFNVNLGQFYMF